MTDSLKKIILAGIGAMATTAEKSKDILDEMVKRGELTVEQGKILNQELKHNIKETVKERKEEKDDIAMMEELCLKMQDMTPDQIARLKDILQKMESRVDQVETVESVKEDAAGQQESGEESCR